MRFGFKLAQLVVVLSVATSGANATKCRATSKLPKIDYNTNFDIIYNYISPHSSPDQLRWNGKAIDFGTLTAFLKLSAQAESKTTIALSRRFLSEQCAVAKRVIAMAKDAGLRIVVGDQDPD